MRGSLASAWVVVCVAAGCGSPRSDPAGLDGSGAGSGVARCGSVVAVADRTLHGADIIVAIDSSGSMYEEMEFTEAHMNDLAARIDDAGIDARLIVLGELCLEPPLGSGHCPGDASPPGYVHLPEPIGSHDALSAIVERHSEYAAYLRPGAPKHLLVISDDNATAPAVADAQLFLDQLESLIPPGAIEDDITVHGVICFEEAPPCVRPGTVYQELVELTDGIAGDLALQDFAPIFEHIADDVIVTAEPLPCNYPLHTYGPVDYGAATVRYVSGAGDEIELPRADGPACHEGWFYDDDAAPREIHLCTTSCSMVAADPHARMEIRLGCVADSG